MLLTYDTQKISIARAGACCYMLQRMSKHSLKGEIGNRHNGMFDLLPFPLRDCQFPAINNLFTFTTSQGSSPGVSSALLILQLKKSGQGGPIGRLPRGHPPPTAAGWSLQVLTMWVSTQGCLSILTIWRLASPE